jgi:hypothetical protein
MEKQLSPIKIIFYVIPKYLVRISQICDYILILSDFNMTLCG